MQQYDKKHGRVHLQEVWKKRLAYGFVTAQQMDAERALHGIDLHEDDWAALDEHLARLTGKSNKRTYQQSSETDIVWQIFSQQTNTVGSIHLCAIPFSVVVVFRIIRVDKECW